MMSEIEGNQLLTYMHEHNKTMCDGFEAMRTRLDKTDDHIERATKLQSEAAAIIKSQSSTQKWMQTEMTAQRKSNEKLQWKLVGALVLTLSGITTALVFLVKVGFLKP
jgi:hypothetical protein